MHAIRLAVLALAALPVSVGHADIPDDMVLVPKELLEATKVQINILIERNEWLQKRYDAWTVGTNCT